MVGQPIRPSQFVLTFGVGSIIEAPEGPRIIGDFERWGSIFKRRDNRTVPDFQISSSEASALLGNGFIFRIPTNIDLGKKPTDVIFKTIPFPEWTKCERHDCLSKMINGVTQCKDCRKEGRLSGRKEAIRFVRACKSGHLDDVDWHGIIHGYAKESCKSMEFLWEAEGSSLRSVYITCKECKRSVRLKDVYNRSYKCSGRFPERGLYGGPCEEEAKVVLRGSSSIRIPELITTITIPPRETKIHRIFERIQIRAILLVQDKWTKKELLDRLRHSSSRDPAIVDPRIIDVLENSSEEQILEAIDDISKLNRKMESLQDVKDEELKALIHAAKYGHPPNPENPTPDLEFQVDAQKIRPEVKYRSLVLRVTPIERLRVVIVQKGYRRLGSESTNKLVETFYFDGQNKWYPGIELIGEGIFIDKPGGFNLKEEQARYWSKFFQTTQDPKTHPFAVWWHTFSHRIINALSLDSGYSSASIRERTYIFFDPVNGNITSGILLYTTQTGGDGTLGGLIDQVPKFERVLESACKNIDFCSNDPLCSEVTKPEKYNGAACHACLFLSETSCEYSNKYLDRNLLRNNL